MTMVGTLLFCAPEITRGQRYNESVASGYAFLRPPPQRHVC